MLVLSRRTGEGLVFEIPPSTQPQRMLLKINEIASGGGKVRIALDAEPQIRIKRDELRDQSPDGGADESKDRVLVGDRD